MNDRILLCVDDEDSVLKSLKRCLRKEAYSVITATGGQEGLDVLEAHPVQVVLSDQRMPGMKGTEFLRRVKDRYPDTIRVVLSGYAEVHAILDSINEGQVYRFLPKPWNDEELKVTLRQCFAHYDLIRQNQDLVVQVQEQNVVLQQLNENLEHAVDERTRSLRFAQEILERLPHIVLGISREQLVALANEAAQQFFSSPTFFCGTYIDEFLPPKLVEAVQQCLEGRWRSSQDLSVPVNGHTVHAQLIRLGEGHAVRGCVLVMEVQ
ncbi:MAG: response regulator [Rhodothermales bacterium]